MKVRLIDQDIEECKKFALEVTKTTSSHYSKRNQTNDVKKAIDNFIGKLGEYACWRYYFKEQEEYKPDIKIYTSVKKSWKKDFPEVSVKSQSLEQAECFTPSWTFQFSGEGKGHCDPIISNPSGMLFLSLVDHKNPKDIDVKAIIPASEAMKFLSDPKKQSLKGIKKVLYLYDLQKEFYYNSCLDILAAKQS